MHVIDLITFATHTDATDRSIEDLPALGLLLTDCGKGPLRRLTVLLITGFTLHTKLTQIDKHYSMSLWPHMWLYLNTKTKM